MRRHRPFSSWFFGCMLAAAMVTTALGAPELILPDGSVLPLPPGAQGFGPEGPEIAPEAPPEEPPPVPKADMSPPVEAPAAPVDAAARRQQALDALFDRLAKAQDPIEASAIVQMIAEAHLDSGSDTADLLMRRAIAAMDGKANDTASDLLDKIIALRPRWAEAWNKRATLRYLENDDVGSMADIGQVLALEPRHFGALTGMGMILHRNGEDKSALTVLRRAAAINPQDGQVKVLIEELRPLVEGSDL